MNNYSDYIIALDLDDTLLTTKKEVSKHTLDVLHRCQDNGFKIAVSSTRGYSTCIKTAKEINADYICCQAGNMIVDKHDNIIYKNPFDHQEINKFIDHFYEITQYIYIDSDKGLYGCMDDSFSRKWNAIYCDKEQLKSINAYKICIKFDSTEDMEYIISYCKDKGYVYRKMIDADFMFITPANSDKYYALEKLMQLLNTTKDKLIVFGDDNSDMLSIKNAGHGIAMSNAKPEIIAVSTYVTDTNDNDGVAKYLENNFKI